MNDIRIIFTKTGKARYISHLDLMRSMQRTIKRAKLPIWYTEGFNPHAYLMFPLALTLGVSSNCEIMDMTLVQEIPFDEILIRLNENFPEGIMALKVYNQGKNHTEIGFAEYRCKISSEDAAAAIEKFDKFLFQEKIEIEKLTKKKTIKIIDIKPLISLVSKEIIENEVVLDIIIPAGTSVNLNVNIVFDEFQKFCLLKFDRIDIQRTKILCNNLQEFF